MSYRYRPLKYARTGYRWWLDRALWFVSEVVDSYLLIEAGDFLLLENGSKIVLDG